MKKNVLFLMLFAFLAIIGAKAQTVVYDWNFSDEIWQPYASDGTPTGYFSDGTVVDFLTFHNPTSATNFAVNASSKNVDGVDYSVRFQFSGAGYSGAANTDVTPSVNMPTQRYLSFDVDGPVTVDVVAITGSSSSPRAIFLTDGTDLIGTFSCPGDNTAYKNTVSYTGDAATLYLYGNQACNIYEIIVSSNDTGIPSINAQKPVQSVEYFNLLGEKVMNDNLKQTVLIKKTTYTDGTTSTEKVITKTY